MPTIGAQPAEDYGFFGSGSVTWKVWAYPTSLTIGFQRAVVVEELDPALVAAVTETRGIYDRPRTRYDRTLRYFAMVAFGDTRSTSKAADVLVKVHSRAVGTEPYSGKPYDANDPDSQLWIHLTAWHSILYAYETYGPGRLSPQDEARYWEECAVAAELQTCDPSRVPRSREGVQAYFERMRPHLAASELARDAMHHLLHNAHLALGEQPWPLRTVARVAGYAVRKGTLATMPRWMRQLSGLRQSRLTDALVRPLLKPAFALVAAIPRLELRLLRVMSPSTVPVVAPVLLGVPPRRPETLTPAQARQRYGYARPAEAHRELRARQRAKVLSGDRPSDEGIRESEPILGATA